MMQVKINNSEVKPGTLIQNNILKDSIVFVTEVLSNRLYMGVYLGSHETNVKEIHADYFTIFTGTVTLQND